MRADWVSISGREKILLEERISLLAQEFFTLSQTNSAADTVYALSVLTQRMKSMISAVKNNKVINLRTLSKVECLVQAWKRGGVDEYNRIVTLQEGATGEI